MNNPFIFFLFFIVLWVAIALLLSFMGGWRELAKQYRYQGQAVHEKRYMQSASMRGLVNYNNCLTLGANPQGLYIAASFLSRPFHPPLFIPWQDIKISTKKVFGFPKMELRFIHVPAITVVLPGALEDFLRSASKRLLPLATAEGGASQSPVRTWTWWVNVIGGVLIALITVYVLFFAQRKF